MEAAQLYADRLLRRTLGPKVRLPRRVAVVWSEQKRGVWHVHEALPAGTEVERIWTRQVVRYVDAMVRRDSRRPATEARTLLDLERELGVVTRGFYGWGFVDRNPLRHLGSSGREGGASKAAAYLARNAARYLGQNADAALEGNELNGRTLRSYVSRRLTMETGVTIRNLRRARHLYVLIRESLPLPEWTVADLEAVWRLLAYSPGAARAP